MPLQPFILDFTPGIQRDGTELSNNVYTDALWCRFQRGQPRKIGGYRTLSQNMTGIPRQLHQQTLNAYTYVHSGYAAGIELVTVDSGGMSSVPADRTPAGYPNDPANMWQMDSYFDTNSAAQQLLAFVAPSLDDLAYGAATGNLYSGPIYATTALTAVSGLATDVTGGVVVLPPYTCLYGSNGLFQWSMPGFPLNFTGEGSGAARVTDQKLVRCYPLWGADGFSPSCLAWTINGLIKIYFVGGAPVFSFDPLTVSSSILSQNGIAEGAGQIYYWIAQDRFLMTNGASVTEVPNSNNLNFFFDNLNRPFGQKAFAFYNPRFGEVWFCAPLFGATEPNWAVIYNDREKIWYDTPLPNGGRSAGVQNDINAGAILGGVQLYNASTYRLWQHERGTDEIDGPNSSAIRSYFTTPILTATTFQQPLDKAIKFDTIEPDFTQSGDMVVTSLTRGNARARFKPRDNVTFADEPVTEQDQQVMFKKTTAKQTKFQFESNTAGGDFQGGKHIAYIEVDQARRTS